MTQTKLRYKRILIRRAAAILMSLLMLLSAIPGGISAAGAESDGMIRVKLTRLGSSVTSITMTTVGGYAVGDTAVPSGSTVKVTLSGGNLTLTAGGKQLASGTKVAMNRTSGGTGTGVRFNSPSLSNLFCGDLAFSVIGNSIQTILKIYVETYLYGVVPYEMSNSFPLEALKAQTIAARTYAMRAKRSSGSYDVTDNTSSQMFKGYNASYANAIAAVDGTQGVVLMAGSAYAQCYYTASNGGQTESAANAWGGSVSYLTVKDDPYDRENPNSIEKSYVIPKKPEERTLSSGLRSTLIAAAADQMKEKGLSAEAEDIRIEEIVSVEPHTPKYETPSRTYTKLRFTMKLTGKSASTGNEVTTQVDVDLNTYSSLQSMLGLSINSADNEIVSVKEQTDGFKLSFARYGHGVGLSQRGAQWMAKQYGKTYEEILDFYYPGVKQTQLSLKDVIVGSAGSVDPEPTRSPVESADGYETLQEGDSGEAVKELQIRLKELGYFTGTPLGNYKTLTVSAVKAYQTANGLTADGVASPALQKMIFGSQQTAPEATATPRPEEGAASVMLSSASSRLNVRKDASMSAAIVGTLKHGDKVTTLSVSGDWTKIQADRLTGYVMTKYLKGAQAETTPTPQPETGADYSTLQYGDSGETVRALQVQLQKLGYFTGTPLGNYKALTQSAVQAYQKAMGLPVDGIATPDLQRMIFAGELPEASKEPEATDKPDAGIIGTGTVSLSSASSRLNVRASASTSAAIVGTLKHGTKVTLLEGGENGWSKIQTDTLTGYVKTAYLVIDGAQQTPAPTTPPVAEEAPTGVAVIRLSSASSRLNVRKEATTASAIVGTLKNGVQVEVLETRGSWSRIRSGSLSGYVMTTYLAEQAEAQPSETPGSDASVQYETLSYGDSGAAVKRLQTRLKELGYFSGELGGNYLKLTRAAVEAYQQANGWNVDGVASAELQKEIFEETNGAQTNASVQVGADSYLNLRKSASSTSEVLARMKNGTPVRVMGTEGDWYRVETASGLAGYAKKDYIRVK